MGKYKLMCVMFLYWQVQESKYGKSNNVSADAAFKSQSKREVINIKEATKKPAPGESAVIQISVAQDTFFFST